MEIKTDENNIKEFEKKKEISENNAFNNLLKDCFTYDNVNYEVLILLYSNAMLINITSCCKFGIIYEGVEEIDNIDDENIYEVKCLMGDRKNEISQFLANILNIRIFNCLKKRSLKIEKNIISISINFKNLTNGTKIENFQSDKKLKEFIEIVKERIEKLLL